MRHHNQPEYETENDSAAADLQRTLNLLLPIRRQRLSRSERQQREQELALQAVVEKSAFTRQRLADRQRDYLRLRQAFAGKNCGVRQHKYRLERALQQEQQAADKVDDERQNLRLLAQQQNEQQQRVEQAQQETRLRLREVEKLEYLLQQQEVFE